MRKVLVALFLSFAVVLSGYSLERGTLAPTPVQVAEAATCFATPWTTISGGTATASATFQCSTSAYRTAKVCVYRGATRIACSSGGFYTRTTRSVSATCWTAGTYQSRAYINDVLYQTSSGNYCS
jgi:hypothetical protein